MYKRQLYDDGDDEDDEEEEVYSTHMPLRRGHRQHFAISHRLPHSEFSTHRPPPGPPLVRRGHPPLRVPENRNTPPRRSSYCIVTALVLLALIVSGIVMAFLVNGIQRQPQPIPSPTRDASSIKIATIQACPTDQSYVMSIDLALYGQNGHQTPPKNYIVLGEKWTLQVVGLNSSYKVTRLEGHYRNPVTDRQAPHKDYDLNQGNNGISLKNLSWPINTTFHQSVSGDPDSQTYDVLLTPNKLLLVAASHPLHSCA